MVVYVGPRQFSNAYWANLTVAEQERIRAEVLAEEYKPSALKEEQ
jgi:hypothetical protein